MRFCKPVARHKTESDGNAYASKGSYKDIREDMFCKCPDFDTGVITCKEFRRTSKPTFILRVCVCVCVCVYIYIYIVDRVAQSV